MKNEKERKSTMPDSDAKKQTPSERETRGPVRDQPGEGNRAADRNYREATREFVEQGRVAKNAKEAARALDGPEAKELERARRESAKGPKPSASGGSAPKKDRA